MNLLDYLDRRDQRRSRSPRRPMDTRAFIGLAFLAGYYWMVYRFMSLVIPEANIPLVRDAMLVLGPAVGLIVGALFRSDIRDEQATVNSGKFADAVKEQAIAAQAASGGTGVAAGAAAVADAAADRADELGGGER